MPDGRLAKDTPAGEATLAHVAMLYYREGLTQGEIAQRMGVSRATIVNYLRMAREQGIVDIRIRGESFAASPLSRQLVERFGLSDAYVAFSDPNEADASLDRVAQLGAAAMHDLLEPGDRLGVAWGDTVQRVARAFPNRAVSDLKVFQMIGSMHAHLLFAAETCTIEIARRTSAACRTLHVPAVVSSTDLAEALRKEPVIARQLAEFASLTKALFSVGHVGPDTTLVAAGIASLPELDAYRKRGAAAVLCGHFIDAAGQPMPGDLTDRTLGTTPAELRRIPVRMLVATGAGKRAAMLATLRGGYVSHLVVDEASAEWLVRSPEPG